MHSSVRRSFGPLGAVCLSALTQLSQAQVAPAVTEEPAQTEEETSTQPEAPAGSEPTGHPTAPAEAAEDTPASDVLMGGDDASGAEPRAQLSDPSVLTKAETPADKPRRKQEKPATRWSEVGAFIGMSYRASSEPEQFKYRPGVAYGGFFRPQITDYLAVGLSYREERITVDAAPGAYDYGGAKQALALHQPALKVTSLSVRIEPSFPVTRYLHVLGLVSWSGVRIVYPMPTADGFEQRADRAGVELNWGLGGGVSVDILHNWVNLSLMGAYHFISNQTGSAYDPIQAIVDGEITHFAPMARPKYLVDVLFSLGLIL